jgi:hypothetical protein
MYYDTKVWSQKSASKDRTKFWWKRFSSRQAHALRPRMEWAPSEDLSLWVLVGNSALISLDLPLTTLVGVTGRRRNILTCTHAYRNNKSKSLSDYAQQDSSTVTRWPQILDMQDFKNDTDSILLVVIINTLK